MAGGVSVLWKKFLLTATLILLILWVVGCTSNVAKPTGGNSVSNGQAFTGEQLVANRCAQCHSLDRVNRDRAQNDWPTFITRMMSKSPSLLTTEQGTLVVGYLQQSYAIK